MKRILSIIAMVTLLGSHCLAQPPRFRMQKNEEIRYALHLDNITMEIDANNGARIVSLKMDTTEVISQLKMPNTYGSTFWTSPQKEWNWPPVREHDMAPYTVTKDGEAIIMTSSLSERFPLRIKKRFEADKQDKCIKVTYTIINESNESREVAPWEITRVLAQGSIFFDADVDAITGANNMEPISFVKKNGFAWYDIDHKEGTNRKINSDGKGWLAYKHNGIVLKKVFQDLSPSEPAPGEAEIQIYVNQGNSYVEIESQGAYTELKPGKSLDWTVRWYLTKE